MNKKRREECSGSYLLIRVYYVLSERVSICVPVFVTVVHASTLPVCMCVSVVGRVNVCTYVGVCGCVGIYVYVGEGRECMGVCLRVFMSVWIRTQFWWVRHLGTCRHSSRLPRPVGR